MELFVVLKQNANGSQPTYFIYNWPFIGVVGDT